VSKGDAIARLEALLERVRARAAQPRPGRSDGAADEQPVLELRRTRSPASQPVLPERMHLESAQPEEESVTSTHTILRDTSAAQERPMVHAHDSRERMVAAEPEAREVAPEDHPARAHESVPPIDVGELEVGVDEEEPEEPPVSSRRPVAPQPEEQLAQMAFGAEEPQQPLHTPPPESGRLPSAPSDEFDQDSDFTGVRTATPLLPRRMADVAPREIAPVAIRAQLVPSDAVAEVIAEAQRFSPSTFVALLDASLSL
jgi:hypothetical protein